MYDYEKKHTNKRVTKYFFRKRESENDSPELIMVKHDGTPVTYKDLRSTHYRPSFIINHLLSAIFHSTLDIMTTDDILAEDVFERYKAITNVYLRRVDICTEKSLEKTKEKYKHF